MYTLGLSITKGLLIVSTKFNEMEVTFSSGIYSLCSILFYGTEVFYVQPGNVQMLLMHQVWFNN